MEREEEEDDEEDKQDKSRSCFPGIANSFRTSRPQPRTNFPKLPACKILAKLTHCGALGKSKFHGACFSSKFIKTRFSRTMSGEIIKPDIPVRLPMSVHRGGVVRRACWRDMQHEGVASRFYLSFS